MSNSSVNLCVCLSTKSLRTVFVSLLKLNVCLKDKSFLLRMPIKKIKIAPGPSSIKMAAFFSWQKSRIISWKKWLPNQLTSHVTWQDGLPSTDKIELTHRLQDSWFIIADKKLIYQLTIWLPYPWSIKKRTPHQLTRWPSFQLTRWLPHQLTSAQLFSSQSRKWVIW